MKKKDKTNYEDEFIKVLKISSDEVQTERNLNKVKKDVYYDTLCKRCNNVWALSGSNIGKVKSCGCYNKTKWMETAKTHVGEKYNNLTIIDVDWERTKYERSKTPSPILDNFYFTKCDCGNVLQHSTRYNLLKSGHIKSCGCSKFNNPLIIEDLTGQTFGRLTVIKRDIERDKKEIDDGKKRGNAHWLCKCSCGNPILKSIVGNQLKSGHIVSCGCYSKEILIERNKRDSTKYNHHDKLKNNSPLFNENNQIEIYDEKDEFCFLIDKEDYLYVNQYYWRKLTEKEEPNPRKRYWVTNEKKEKINMGYQTTLRLHQIIATNKYGVYDKQIYMPDHLDRNPDNNTRANLYLKTNIENTHNRGLSRTNSSGKTGVRWDNLKNKYQAYICVNYKNIHLGYFDNFDEAVKIRKEAEEKYGFTCDDILADYDY